MHYGGCSACDQALGGILAGIAPGEPMQVSCLSQAAVCQQAVFCWGPTIYLMSPVFQAHPFLTQWSLHSALQHSCQGNSVAKQP